MTHDTASVLEDIVTISLWERFNNHTYYSNIELMELEKTDEMAAHAAEEVLKNRNIGGLLHNAEKETLAAMRTCYIKGWLDFAGSVWHDGKTIPEKKLHFIYEMKLNDHGRNVVMYNVDIIRCKSSENLYKELVEQGKIARWAYIFDLLPKMS